MTSSTKPDIDILASRLDDALYAASSADDKTAAVMRSENMQRWIFSMFSISGSTLSHEQIKAMMDEECVFEATIEEFQLLEACRSLKNEFNYMADFATKPDRKHLSLFNTILSGSDSALRNHSLYIEEMNSEAPSPESIPAGFRECEIEYLSHSSSGTVLDVLSGAVKAHDMLLSLWPFENSGSITAYAALSYELYLSGFPLPTLNLTHFEHLRLCAEYVHAGTSTGILSLLLMNLIEECRF